MTRETKIGLLVGLAFIIVIGILLSDHLTSSTEPPQAALAGAGNNVRSAVTVPGQPGPQPVVITPPSNVALQNQVPTQSELTPPPNPVQIVKVGPGTSSNPQPRAVVAINQPATGAQSTVDPASANDAPPTITQVPPTPANVQQNAGANTTTNGSSPMDAVARQHGEELVPLTPANTTGRTPRGTLRTAAPGAPAAYTEYKVEAGDSLSKIASRIMGSASRPNLDAIIALNPSLKADPNKVIVGRTYRIPNASSVSTNTASTPNAAASTDLPAPVITNDPAMSAPAAVITQKPTVGSAENWYTVKDGDSLWHIATDQCGEPGAVAAIKELNKDTLKGENYDVIRPGMKLRLPAKSLASAN